MECDREGVYEGNFWSLSQSWKVKLVKRNWRNILCSRPFSFPSCFSMPSSWRASVPTCLSIFCIVYSHSSYCDCFSDTHVLQATRVLGVPVTCLEEYLLRRICLNQSYGGLGLQLVERSETLCLCLHRTQRVLDMEVSFKSGLQQYCWCASSSVTLRNCSPLHIPEGISVRSIFIRSGVR